MRPSHFDVQASQTSYEAEIAKVVEAAMANPAWHGHERELRLQVELNVAIANGWGGAILSAINDEVPVASIVHALGVALGSAMVTIENNFGGTALSRTIGTANGIRRINRKGADEDRGQYAGVLHTMPTVGGSA